MGEQSKIKIVVGVDIFVVLGILLVGIFVIIFRLSFYDYVDYLYQAAGDYSINSPTS